MAEQVKPGNKVIWHLIAWLGRLTVAFFFFYAGSIKIGDPTQFAWDIRGYAVFPEVGTNAMAYLIPWFEVVTVTLLLIGLWRKEARLLIQLMLVAFTTLKIYALLNGHDLDCGCFGDSFLGRVSKGWDGVWMNLGLITVLLIEGFASYKLNPRKTARAPGNAAGNVKPATAK